jgi:hypothetical protein
MVGLKPARRHYEVPKMLDENVREAERKRALTTAYPWRSHENPSKAEAKKVEAEELPLAR